MLLAGILVEACQQYKLIDLLFMKNIFSGGIVIAVISAAILSMMISAAQPAAALQTKTVFSAGLGAQLKENLKNIFPRPKTTATPTVSPTPKPRKTEITVCKEAFNAAKKIYADAKEKARNEYLVSLKKATNDYKAAYKLARENKSNEAKKSARDAHDRAEPAVE